MNGIVLEAVYKISALLGLKPKKKVTGENPDKLKEKILSEKKNDVKVVRRANNTIRILIEKGEFEVRVIRSKGRKNATKRKKD